MQAELSAAYISKDKVYSQELGEYKGIKVRPDPAWATTPFYKSEVSRDALDYLLRGNRKSALGVIKSGLNILDKKINEMPEDSDAEKLRFLSFNKSKEAYIGFNAGKRYRFCLPGAHDPDGEEAEVPFVMLPKNEPGKKEKKQQKYWIHPISKYRQTIDRLGKNSGKKWIS